MRSILAKFQDGDIALFYPPEEYKSYISKPLWAHRGQIGHVCGYAAYGGSQRYWITFSDGYKVSTWSHCVHRVDGYTDCRQKKIDSVGIDALCCIPVYTLQQWAPWCEMEYTDIARHLVKLRKENLAYYMGPPAVEKIVKERIDMVTKDKVANAINRYYEAASKVQDVLEDEVLDWARACKKEEVNDTTKIGSIEDYELACKIIDISREINAAENYAEANRMFDEDEE